MVSVLKPPIRYRADPMVPSIFLAGSIEMGKAEDWQTRLTDAVKDFNCVVYNPRRDDWDSSWKQEASNPQFNEQVTWELDHLDKATIIALYFDPKTQSPISLLELGLHSYEGKVVCFCPEGYFRRGNVEIVCERYGIPFVGSWSDFVAEIRKRLGESDLKEDAPVNNTGSGTDGAIKGVGGLGGEPGLKKSTVLRRKTFVDAFKSAKKK
jgi:hypothetical protein